MLTLLGIGRIMPAGRQGGEAFQAWLWQQLEGGAGVAGCAAPQASDESQLEQWCQEARAVSVTQVQRW